MSLKTSLSKAKKRINVKDSKTDNIELYDSDNRYPQRVIDIINASGCAKVSVELYSKFIIGGGFKDETFYKAIINKKGLTADKLLRAVAWDYSHVGGRAYHVNYNGLLQVSEVSHVPYEYCRLGSGEMAGYIAVYEDWECTKENRIDTSKIKWYHKFTSEKPVTIAEITASGGIVNYCGQIYTDSKYPLAPIDPVLQYAISDSNIQVFTDKAINNGFNPSAIFRYTKEFEGKEGQKEWEQVQEDISQFQGPEHTGRIFTVAGISKEDFEVYRLSADSTDKMYDSTYSRVSQNIRQRFKQPPSLLGVRGDGAIFSSQNIEDDTKYYNSVTSDERMLIEEDMKILFSNFYYKVNSTDDWSILELRFNAIATEIPSKISTLGIGGTQALLQILQGTLDDIQKVNTIVLVFGFTTEEAQSMVLPINKPAVQ